MEMQEVSIVFGSSSIRVKVPGQCPACGAHANVSHVTSTLVAHELVNERELPRKYKDTLNSVILCQRKSCSRYILCVFERIHTIGKIPSTWRFVRAYPNKVQVTEFSDDVKKISQNFVTIYNQAERANISELIDIAGPGFRKAAEFLIKDYAIKLEPDDEAKIKKMPSAKVITNYLKDPKIEKVAKRALWLGNDETHYERRWERKNINDFITLINLTTHFIEMAALADEYEDEMPDTS